MPLLVCTLIQLGPEAWRFHTIAHRCVQIVMVCRTHHLSPLSSIRSAESHCTTHMILSHVQVKKHNTTDSCWVVADGLVFDVTEFLPLHPAGVKSIMMRAGGDATRDYRFHSAGSRDSVWKKVLPSLLHVELL